MVAPSTLEPSRPTIRHLGLFRAVGATLRTFVREPIFFLALAAVQLIPLQPILRLFGLSVAGHWFSLIGPITFDQILLDLVQAAMLHRALRFLDEGRAPLRETIGPGVRRALPVLVASLVQLLAGTLGFALLVVPGFFVSAALLLAGPLCLEGQPPFRSLGQSWRLTRGSRWPLAGALLALWLPYIAVVVGVGFYDAITGHVMKYALYVIAPAAVVASAWTTVLAAVSYHMLRPDREREQLADVFA